LPQIWQIEATTLKVSAFILRHDPLVARAAEASRRCANETVNN